MFFNLQADYHLNLLTLKCLSVMKTSQVRAHNRNAALALSVQQSSGAPIKPSTNSFAANQNTLSAQGWQYPQAAPSAGLNRDQEYAFAAYSNQLLSLPPYSGITSSAEVLPSSNKVSLNDASNKFEKAPKNPSPAAPGKDANGSSSKAVTSAVAEKRPAVKSSSSKSVATSSKTTSSTASPSGTAPAEKSVAPVVKPGEIKPSNAVKKSNAQRTSSNDFGNTLIHVVIVSFLSRWL
jgi:hypothetical protein